MDKLSILIVDDEPEVAKFMRTMLLREAPDFKIHFVDSGRECLRYVKENPADCILSDYQMPGMDGMELLSALRVQGDNTPFIFVTGQGNEQVSRDAFKNGASDYFTKEIGFAHFARIVNSVKRSVRHRIAQDAKKEELNFRQAIENSILSGIAGMDLEGRLTYVNRAFCGMVGWGKKELIGLGPPFVFWPPEDRDALDKTFRSMLNGKMKSRSLEVRYMRKNGERFYVLKQISAINDLQGRTKGWLNAVYDITKHKRAGEALFESEKRLQESEQRFRFSTEAAGIGTWNWDVVNEKIVWNARCKEMFGYKPDDDITYEAFLGAVHEEDREKVEASVHQALREKKEFMAEMRAVMPDGGIRWIMSKGRGVYDSEGVTIGMHGVALDITEQKEQDREREEFLAMLTHDLKSPITTIVGFSELLQTVIEERDLDLDLPEMVGSIRSSAFKLADMVENFLAISKIEAGKVELHLGPVSLAEVLEEIKEELLPVAEKKRIDLAAEISDVPTANLDNKLIERAITNLLHNALTYTPSGGRVVLRASGGTREPGRRRTARGFIAISVQDTGPGVTEEEKCKIFNKYYRSPKAAGIKGTGLGLAIVKAVAEAHGGRVDVRGEPGKGSTFFIFIPTGREVAKAA